MNVSVETPRPTSNRERILFFLAAAPERGLHLRTLIREVLGEDKPARPFVSEFYAMISSGLVVVDMNNWVTITETGLAENDRLMQPAFDISKPLAHPGPSALDMATGMLNVGVNRAGESYSWRLWNGGGARNSIVVGQAGSGVTNTLAGVLRAVNGRPEIETTIVDTCMEFRPDELTGAVAVADTQDAVSAVVHNLARLAEQRMDIIRESQSRGWGSPNEALPLHLLVVTNFVELIGRFAELRIQTIERTLRVARKVGIGIVAGARTGSIASFGSVAIRDAMMSGNGLLLRTLDRMSAPAWPNQDRLTQISSRFEDGTVTAGLGHDLSGEQVRAFWVAS